MANPPPTWPGDVPLDSTDESAGPIPEDGPGEGLGPEGKAEVSAPMEQLDLAGRPDGLRKAGQGMPTPWGCGCIPGF